MEHILLIFVTTSTGQATRVPRRNLGSIEWVVRNVGPINIITNLRAYAFGVLDRNVEVLNTTPSYPIMSSCSLFTNTGSNTLGEICPKIYMFASKNQLLARSITCIGCMYLLRRSLLSSSNWSLWHAVVGVWRGAGLLNTGGVQLWVADLNCFFASTTQSSFNNIIVLIFIFVDRFCTLSVIFIAFVITIVLSSNSSTLPTNNVKTKNS